MNLPNDLIVALQTHIQRARQFGYNGGFVLVTGMKELHNQVLEIGGVQFRWRYQDTDGTIEHNEDKSLYWHTASPDHIRRHWAEFRIYEPEVTT